MRVQEYVKYTCGCKQESEFKQCDERQGTNVKCDPIKKVLVGSVQHYCRKHLVPDHAVSFTDQVGHTKE